MPAEIVELYPTNFQDVPAMLRKLADDIEAGAYGPVGCVSSVVLGDQMRVFGFGPDSEGPAAAMLLHAGFMHMSRAIEEHGR